MWHNRRMDRISDILDRLHAYCAVWGLRPDAVVRAATGNPRLYDRLKARRRQTEYDIERIAARISAPPSCPVRRPAGAGRRKATETASDSS
jgi:hypothetical protein